MQRSYRDLVVRHHASVHHVRTEGEGTRYFTGSKVLVLYRYGSVLYR